MDYPVLLCLNLLGQYLLAHKVIDNEGEAYSKEHATTEIKEANKIWVITSAPIYP